MSLFSIILFVFCAMFYFFSGFNKSTKPDKGPINPPDCTILDTWVFDNFTLSDELFTQALRSLEYYRSVDNNLCLKSVSSLELPITFTERFKITSVSFLFLILIY